MTTSVTSRSTCIMGPVKRRDNGIFGSPPQPIFNVHALSMSGELLTEWLQVLAQDNTRTMEEASHQTGYFMTGKAVEFVMRAAKRLDLPTTAKYLAIELFEKFMVAHINDLYRHAIGLKSNKRKEWQTIQGRVRNQIALRALSCCQLATKLTSHYQVMSPDSVKSLLAELGHNYSRESVLQSEIRILKTVKYHVMVNPPLVYIETLLEIIGSNDSTVNVKPFHSPCLQLLDIVYLRNVEIYDCLHHVATGKLPSSIKDRKKIATVKKDYMLLASAIVSASSYIIDLNKTDKIIEALSQITRIPSDDILDFATIIIQQLSE